MISTANYIPSEISDINGLEEILDLKADKADYLTADEINQQFAALAGATFTGPVVLQDVKVGTSDLRIINRGLASVIEVGDYLPVFPFGAQFTGPVAFGTNSRFDADGNLRVQSGRTFQVINDGGATTLNIGAGYPVFPAGLDSKAVFRQGGGPLTLGSASEPTGIIGDVVASAKPFYAIAGIDVATPTATGSPAIRLHRGGGNDLRFSVDDIGRVRIGEVAATTDIDAALYVSKCGGNGGLARFDVPVQMTAGATVTNGAILSAAFGKPLNLNNRFGDTVLVVDNSNPYFPYGATLAGMLTANAGATVTGGPLTVTSGDKQLDILADYAGTGYSAIRSFYPLIIENYAANPRIVLDGNGLTIGPSSHPAMRITTNSQLLIAAPGGSLPAPESTPTSAAIFGGPVKATGPSLTLNSDSSQSYASLFTPHADLYLGSGDGGVIMQSVGQTVLELTPNKTELTGSLSIKGISSNADITTPATYMRIGYTNPVLTLGKTGGTTSVLSDLNVVGAVDSTGFSVGGTPGISGTFALPTSITVVGGLITSIT